MKHRRWVNAWLLSSVLWISAVAYIAIWENQTQGDRLHYWADAMEETINGDPMVPKSAKELRARLGDERFVAAAQGAYPQVDLRDLTRRYEADMARHRHFDFHWAVAWALLPPLVLFVFGLAVARPQRESISANRRSRR